MVASNDVGFAAGPAGVVGRGAGEGGVEEGLVWRAEAADVDDEDIVASDGEIVKENTEGPGGCGVEVREGEGLFLEKDAGGVLFWGGEHGESLR